MPPRAKRTGGSLLEQLLSSVGIHRHSDPFAHLAGYESAVADWFQARIMGCLSSGVCPLCDAHESSLSDYLFWLPANLRDADYFLSLYEEGGFCSEHLVLAMTHLRGFPYGRVRLFMLVRMLLEGGRSPSERACHLCRTLERSQRVYLSSLRDLMSVKPGFEVKPLLSYLCPNHAKALDGTVTEKPDKCEHGTGALGELEVYHKATLMRTLDKIAVEFHRMSIKELRKELDECEFLLLRTTARRG